MYNGVGLTKGLSITKIIGGLSKTLQIANQVIPLYQKAKPMISNAKTLFGVVKEMGKNTNNNYNQKMNTEQIKTSFKTNEKAESIKKEKASPSPTFFL